MNDDNSDTSKAAITFHDFVIVINGDKNRKEPLQIAAENNDDMQRWLYALKHKQDIEGWLMKKGISKLKNLCMSYLYMLLFLIILSFICI